MGQMRLGQNAVAKSGKDSRAPYISPSHSAQEGGNLPEVGPLIVATTVATSQAAGEPASGRQDAAEKVAMTRETWRSPSLVKL